MMNGRAHFAHLRLPLIDPHGRYIWNACERSTYVVSSVYIYGCFKANISPRFRSRIEVSQRNVPAALASEQRRFFKIAVCSPLLLTVPHHLIMEESRSRGVWNLEAHREGIVQGTSIQDTEISVFQGISITLHREDHGVIRRILLVPLRDVSELDKRPREGRFIGGFYARDVQSRRGIRSHSMIFSCTISCDKFDFLDRRVTRSIDRNNRIVPLVSPN
jgi:hypothetical protein